MRFIIQLLLLCLFLGFVFHMGGTSIFTVLDIPSLLFILILGHLFLVTNFRPKEIFEAYTIAFRKEVNNSILKRSKLIMKTLEKYMIYSGVVGFFIGVIMVLSRLDDLSTIGPALAVALLTALYSIIYCAIIINPIIVSIKNRD